MPLTHARDIGRTQPTGQLNYLVFLLPPLALSRFRCFILSLGIDSCLDTRCEEAFIVKWREECMVGQKRWMCDECLLCKREDLPGSSQHLLRKHMGL